MRSQAIRSMSPHPARDARGARIQRLVQLVTYDFTNIGASATIDPGLIVCEHVPVWEYGEYVVMCRVHRINIAAGNTLNVDVVEDYWCDEDPATSFVQAGGAGYVGMIMSLPIDSTVPVGRVFSQTAYQYSHKSPYLGVRLRPVSGGSPSPFDVDLTIDLYLRYPT